MSEDGLLDFNGISISDLISLCLSCETKKDAENIMRQYEQYCDAPEIARGNLGYIFGYCDEEDRKKLYDLFPVSHPIFGSEFGGHCSSSNYKELKEEFDEDNLKPRKR